LYYLLSVSFPISAANLVRAKSRGYTNVKPIAPAHPPAIRFPKKNFPFYFIGSTPAKNLLYKASLTEKLIAVVGKYLKIFAQLPLQKALGPSSL